MKNEIKKLYKKDPVLAAKVAKILGYTIKIHAQDAIREFDILVGLLSNRHNVESMKEMMAEMSAKDLKNVSDKLKAVYKALMNI